ncbi:hypothetical protein BDV10DRAFT_185221 [Aspergillus recurvatus]
MPRPVPSRLPFLVLLLWALIALSSSQSTATCYFPRQNRVAVGHVPCRPGRESHCCSPDAICLGNGLCLRTAQPYVLARESCTVNNFNTEACNNDCVECNPDGGCSIILLTNRRNEEPTYCCNSIVSSANGSGQTCGYGQPFRVGRGGIIPGVAALQDFVVANSSSNSTDNSADCPDCEATHEAAIGAGVGVPLGVIALTAIAWALFERRRRKRAGVPVPYASPGPEYAPQKPRGQQGVYLNPSDAVELETRQPVYSTTNVHHD